MKSTDEIHHDRWVERMPTLLWVRYLFRITWCPDNTEVQCVAGPTKLDGAIKHPPPRRDPKGPTYPQVKEREVVAGPKA